MDSNQINGGSPLIIIDGVAARAQDLATLNPDDVANISVLKDASAAAIYGARASFGVLLIKTKKGRGEMKVTYNDLVSFKRPTVLLDVETNPYLVAEAKNRAAFPFYSELYSQNYLDYAKQVAEGTAPATRISNSENASWSHVGATDWFNEVYQKDAVTHNRNIFYFW